MSFFFCIGKNFTYHVHNLVHLAQQAHFYQHLFKEHSFGPLPPNFDRARDATDFEYAYTISQILRRNLKKKKKTV